MRGLGLRRVDVWLATVVLAWSLSIVASKVVIEEGWPPLAYSAMRFLLAGLLLMPVVGRTENGAGVGETLRSIAGSGWARGLIAVGVAALVCNQAGFGYALDLGDASTVALVFGTAPVLMALVSVATGTERLHPNFLLAAAASVAGVAVIALSQDDALGSTGVAVVLLALLMTAGFAVSSVSAMPLMRVYSALTVSALTFVGAGAVLLAIAIPQVSPSDFDFGPWIWLCFAFTIVSLAVANVLFLAAAKEVGPSHASLFSNVQPFVAALLSVVLLSEPLSGLEVLGGALVVAAVAIAVRNRRSQPPATPIE